MFVQCLSMVDQCLDNESNFSCDPAGIQSFACSRVRTTLDKPLKTALRLT
jgi:hypothetical protein